MSYPSKIFCVTLMASICLVLSCSPVKRLQLLQSNHPDLFSTDTTRGEVHFNPAAIGADTVFNIRSTSDTITHIRDGRKTRIIYYKDTSTGVRTLRITDTVYPPPETHFFPVFTKKSEVREAVWIDKNRWWVYPGGILLLALLVIVIVSNFIKSLFK